MLALARRGQEVSRPEDVITLPEDNDPIVPATYHLYLPTEAELRAELTREREEAERMLRLAAAPAPSDGAP